MPRTLSPQLARSGGAELLEAHRRCRDLLRAAAGLAEASQHDPRAAACDAAGCLLPVLGCDATVCALARRLGPLSDTAGRVVAVEAALDRFLTAARRAVDAVRMCRQTAHPSGYCWFSGASGTDGCGEVLQLAHRLG